MFSFCVFFIIVGIYGILIFIWFFGIFLVVVGFFVWFDGLCWVFWFFWFSRGFSWFIIYDYIKFIGCLYDIDFGF